MFAGCRCRSCALRVEDAAEVQADAPRQRLDEFVTRRAPVPLAPLARHRLARRLPHQSCLRAARRTSFVVCHARAHACPHARTHTCMKASSACVSDSLLPHRLRSRCDRSLKKSFTFSPDLSCTCGRTARAHRDERVALAHFPLGAAAGNAGRQRGKAASGCTMPPRERDGAQATERCTLGLCQCVCARALLLVPDPYFFSTLTRTLNTRTLLLVSVFRIDRHTCLSACETAGAIGANAETQIPSSSNRPALSYTCAPRRASAVAAACASEADRTASNGSGAGAAAPNGREASSGQDGCLPSALAPPQPGRHEP